MDNLMKYRLAGRALTEHIERIPMKRMAIYAGILLAVSLLPLLLLVFVCVHITPIIKALPDGRALTWICSAEVKLLNRPALQVV